MSNEQKNSLLEKADHYAKLIYRSTRKFPKEEQFGLTSQLRRAALSVPLNIIEGYTRKTKKNFAQFVNISYGSLKESQYLLNFALSENFMAKESYKSIYDIGDEVGAMLWKTMKTLEKK